MNGTPLQLVTKAQQALWVKYATELQGHQGYPFIDFGNKAVITGPLFSPQVLHGLIWAQIGSKLKNPNDPMAQNIDGAANYIIGAICKMTGNKPEPVCAAAPIPPINAKL